MELNTDEKFWPINWQNNTTAKIFFALEWPILILYFVILGIFGGQGGATELITLFIFGPFAFCWTMHLIISVFIKRDRADKIFSLINMTIFLLPSFLALIRNIFG